MRIVAGELRGRTLVAPKGHSTRPTADRTREALFNVLEHAAWSPGLQGCRVIDLFAGSGALGLEALSRGAAFCRFVDSDLVARDATKCNLAALRLDERALIAGEDAGRLPPRRGRDGGPFDFAFLDPPYGGDLGERALAALVRGNWLAPEAIVILERGAEEGDLQAPGYEILNSRVWGAARVCFLAYAPTPKAKT